MLECRSARAPWWDESCRSQGVRNPAHFCLRHRSLRAQVNLSLTIASTTMVHSEMLGKLAGLYNMSESLGRFMGPAGFATVFAWSISTSSPHWVDCRFVFWAAAAAMALVAFVAWGTLTQEKVMPQPSTSSPPPPHSINQACVRGVPVVSCGGSKQEMV